MIPCSMKLTIVKLLLLSMISIGYCGRFVEIPAEKKLMDYLSGLYTWPVRSVANYSDRLIIILRFRLLRIAELNLKDQLLTVNVLIDHEWTDYKLKWDPDQFNGITRITLPSSQLWLPDLQLYNSQGSYQLPDTTAVVYSNGLVEWQATSILKSYCFIEVTYYPFDIQSCNLTFGSWSYDGNKLWMTLKDLPESERESFYVKLPVAMNLDYYYQSVEWDLLSIPAEYKAEKYPCCVERYIHIYFSLTLRRHSKFYMVNIILPLLGLSYLSILVFYLPADSGEKITLCVTLLASQTTFLLLMMDNIPVTSLAVPLLGKIIIFNMLLSFCCIFCTTIVLNVHYRKPTTHRMPNWVKNFGHSHGGVLLTRLLLMGTVPERTKSNINPNQQYSSGREDDVSRLCKESLEELSGEDVRGHPSWKIQRAFQNVYFVREYMQREEEIREEHLHWKFLAAVMDRIFLITFNTVYFIGMFVIMMDAPALFDRRNAIDKYSLIA